MKKSDCELVGTISNIERIDTSSYGNPRYSFTLSVCDPRSGLVQLQTGVNSLLGYSITNYNNKKVIVTTRQVRSKLCATKVILVE